MRRAGALLGDDVDNAAHRVRTIESALRAFRRPIGSMALGANIAKSKSPLAAVGSLIRMPSIITRVWPVSAPRSRMFVVEPGPPLSEISRPGTVRKTSTSEPGLLWPCLTFDHADRAAGAADGLGLSVGRHDHLRGLCGRRRGYPRPAVPGSACDDLDLGECGGPAWVDRPDCPPVEVDRNSTARAQHCDNKPTRRWLPSRQHILANP